MTIIMLCGGRKCPRLSPLTIKKVKDAHDAGHKFVVGDCYGADVMFQFILKTIGADAVVSYIGDMPRNNPQGFPTVKVHGFAQTDKDDAMRAIANDIIYEPVGAGSGTMASVRYFRDRTLQ